MQPATQTATTTSGPQPYMPDLVTPLLSHLGETLGFGADGIFSFMQTTWSVYSIIAYLFSFVFLYIFMYASIRLSHLVAARKEIVRVQRQAYLQARGSSVVQSRWKDIEQHASSSNPNDWKQAIIEADVMLDESLKRRGFTGSSLGERLRAISPQVLESIDDAWTAHKVRNEIAHGGMDFVLTQRLTRETIERYRRVFAELKIL